MMRRVDCEVFRTSLASKSPNASAMHDSLPLLNFFLACPLLRCFGLLLLGLCRSLILAPLAAIRIRHLLITSTALVCRVILFGHIGVGVGLKVFVEALVVFVSRAAVGTGSDNFLFRRIDVRVVEGGLNEGGGLATLSTEYLRIEPE